MGASVPPPASTGTEGGGVENNDTTPDDADDTQIVLAEGYELGGYNPVNGYAESGVSPIYDGLYRPNATTDDVVPDLAPALAQGPPEPAGPNRWRIPLRAGVQFSDGTAFDSADVVATYAAVADPAVASEIATAVTPIVAIEPDGPEAVTVELTTAADPRPYLLLGILPSERVESAPAGDWAVNTEPVGTGPYRFDDWRKGSAITLVKWDGYRDPKAATIQRATFRVISDPAAQVAALERLVAGLHHVVEGGRFDLIEPNVQPGRMSGIAATVAAQ